MDDGEGADAAPPADGDEPVEGEESKDEAMDDAAADSLD
jgi:hypothetical protein